MTEFCHEYLSVCCDLLYVFIMSHTQLRVNLHSVIACMPTNFYFETGVISENSVTVTGIDSNLRQLSL